MADEETEEEQNEEEQAPSGVSAEIRAKLLAGVTREELEAEGYNKNSIRTIASEIKTELGKKGPVGKRPTGNERAKLQVFSKGSPPEAIVQSLDVPRELDGNFEVGMKFGMMSIISGIRIAQELSQIGVQQARPLVDMARDMRSGEAAAARAAATEAAADAAGQVQNNLAPFLSRMDSRLSSIERPRTGNPMQDMMVRMMEPLMQQTIQKIMPGMAPGQQGPPGWTTEKE